MNIRLTLTAILLLLATPRLCVAAEVVVVCPPRFQESLQPWLTYRNDQGIRSVVIAPMSDSMETLRAIASVADHSTKYVMLVGDAPTIGVPTNLNSQVPIHYRPTTVTAAWRSTPTLATDLPYGDLDQDGTPDVAVGRLPVDDESQLQAFIEKVICYETCQDFGTWRNDVQLIGGVGGFGALVDATIESVTRSIVTGVLPTSTNTRVRFASPGHAFFPKNASFTDTVLNDYRAGSRFWVYAGHGQVTHLDHVAQREVPAGQTSNREPVLDRNSAAKLQTEPGRWPIALLLACYTGAIDASEDSIAERMWLRPGGPIGVISGCRVTMPYGNTTAAVGLIDSVYTQKQERLGDAWLASVQSMRLATNPDQSGARMMIDAMAAMVSPAGSDLAKERIEHSQLYNLIGDPTLALQHPSDVKIEVGPGYDYGSTIETLINSSIDGTLHLLLEHPLGSVVDGDANERSVELVKAEVQQGTDRLVSLTPPANFSGPLVIRAHVEGKQGWASSTAKTIVRGTDR
ncbi:hypothetical protein Pla22_18820 [Rubripirellula amarantea]|uniref:Gingipain domain-containing protein n=1 Tax=Rubripirellula amarantea TaxID=2527999 RepID=A0A5C5WVS9_9BACT|nr:C25 family cysteine peptidase [Rubripirellula amarantea]TWT54241.1 hypothetical protein Pla22_18820 [Rubripirellula amarantea]